MIFTIKIGKIELLML